MTLFDEIAWRVLMVTLVSLIVYTISYPLFAEADRPHESCECRELVRIRLLLEHQFGVVCDERHCEGGSSSSNGGELP